MRSMQSNGITGVLSAILRVSAAVLMLGVAFPAHAELERVGPTSNDPKVGGFPAWYQDKTGVAIEFCAPINQAEADSGHCNLVAGDAIAPEAFPTNFFDEHFYFVGSADLAPANGGRALLVLALESAFVTNVVQGDQVMFARIRIRLDPVPATGTYRFIHPYGEDSIDAVAGDRIFATDDAGLSFPGGSFEGATHGRMGPFLLPSNTPGGAELPAVTGPAPGKLYIADPGRVGPVTGTALPDFTDSTGALRNHNIFRIEGPAGSALGGVNADGTTIDFIETTDFSLIGRLFTDTMPGRVTVKRASYASNASGNRLDVFAKGDPTTQGRLPTQPRPAAVLPELSYFEGSCGAPTVAGDFTAPAASLTAVQMFADGNKYWAQTTPATVPANVCVKDAAARDAAGAIVPAFFQAKVTDKVTISQANYDPAARTLSVLATSSDTVNAPILSLDGFPALTVSGVVAPPDRVRVTSSRGGSVEYDVETGAAVAAPPAAIVAANDAFTIAEDTSASLDLLGNDTGAAGGIVTLVTQPRLGTASVNPDGTVTFTANANASGTDGFSYRVSVGALVSNTASVSISITAVNDATTAVNDGPFTARAGIASVLPNVLDNDIDADGRTDLVDAVELVATGGATVTGGAGGVVTFTAPAPGNYAFTYRALDRAGNLSNTATVIVSVIGEDTVVAASALFRTDKSRWVVSGSDDQPNQTITLTYFDGPAAGTVIGTATGDAAGNWLFDQRGVTGVLNPTTLTPRPSQLEAKSSLGGTSRITITIRN
jgi:hypothetical protein